MIKVLTNELKTLRHSLRNFAKTATMRRQRSSSNKILNVALLNQCLIKSLKLYPVPQPSKSHNSTGGVGFLKSSRFAGGLATDHATPGRPQLVMTQSMKEANVCTDQSVFPRNRHVYVSSARSRLWWPKAVGQIQHRLRLL
jgi:hypothetical protein